MVYGSAAVVLHPLVEVEPSHKCPVYVADIAWSKVPIRVGETAPHPPHNPTVPQFMNGLVLQIADDQLFAPVVGTEDYGPIVIDEDLIKWIETWSM